MTTTNTTVDHQAERLRRLAIDIERAYEHADRELVQAHPWASDTMPERVSGTQGGSPVESQQMLSVFDMRANRRKLQDWIEAGDHHLRTGRHLIDIILHQRLPGNELFDATDYATLCKHSEDRIDNGTPDGTTKKCTNWASNHLLPLTGQTIEGWCDDHWALTCHIHGDHPHEGRRVDGVLCCQNAYRKHQRDNVKDVA